MKTENPKAVLLELHYLPCIDYIDCLNSFDKIILEQHEFYQKQSYRNRCYVLGANKTEILSVPILDGTKKILVKDVKIDYSERWTTIHWRTIEAAYRKSPFFEYFADYLFNVYAKKPIYLWDLNHELLTVCLKLAKIKKTIAKTEKYETQPNEGVFDARTLFNPKKTLESNIFKIDRKYHQNFGNEFAPNLSIIDLLFCKGGL